MQRVTRALAAVLAGAAILTAAGRAAAQSSSTSQQTDAPLQATNKLSAAPPVTYDNRYELYGGVNYMNFQAGQNIPKRMNLVGVELLGTYWLTSKIGLGGEFRGEVGTTPVFPSASVINPTTRPLIALVCRFVRRAVSWTQEPARGVELPCLWRRGARQL